MADGDHEGDSKKSHRKKHSGVSADKKKAKTKPNDENLTARQRNPKAFAIQSAVRAERRFRRTEDLTAKKQHIPLVDKTPDEPPPVLIAVVGPPKVGKSTLINNLIKSFTRTNVTNINGPITIVTSKKRRITLIECNNDVNAMIDIAKCADLVLLLCDASFGFEMEIFEFLNICQVHGMPKVMGILTHLDAIRNAKTLKRRKKELKHRFWTEVYDGAKLFYLSGILHGEYLRNEIKNLGRFISIMKFRPLTWRGAHSYLLADRMEDVTSVEQIRLQPKCDRDVVLYGYVRGVPMNKENMVHVAGLGDLRVAELSALPDPCAMPTGEKKRSLMEKERLLYAPMSGVGGIVYDKDAVYIELQGSHRHREEANAEQEEIVQELIGKKETFDAQIENQEFKLFSDGAVIKSGAFREEARRAELEEENEEDDDDDDGEDVDEDDDGGEEVDSDMEEAYESAQKQRGKGWMGDDSDGNDEDDDEVEQNSSESDEEYEENVARKVNAKRAGKSGEESSDGDDDIDDDDDDDVEEEETEDDRDKNAVLASNLSWKENLAQKARNAYLERQANTENLMKLVYGVFTLRHKRLQLELEALQDGQRATTTTTAAAADDDDDIGGLFKVVSAKQSDLLKEKETRDQVESCFFEQYGAEQRDWIHEENKALIKDCFVTGKWRASEDAAELLRLDDLSDAESEVYGDFEDLETGEKNAGGKPVGAGGGAAAAAAQPAAATTDDDDPKKRPYSRVEQSNLNKTELMAKKMKLKAQFDSEYDNTDDGRITGDHQYYEELKKEANKQAELNKTIFAGLDDDLRIQLEGHRAGMYVRIGFKGVPCEFVQHFDPTHPILIGSLNMTEENIGYINCKVKKHRWYKKILKTADPVIVSMGWRRFQTRPIYAKIEDDMKHRYLKYTPNHVTCSMTLWGPITPQNTGFLMVQSVQQNAEEIRRLGFRIAATGCVTEIDKTAQIMKKLKLVGTPLKIYKKSAFIKGMFTSALEVAKFEGAKIKTVSGIRGQIKKAHNKPEGSYRATFEDKIMLSDIVFCRTWFRVEVPRFYAPVTSLLLPPDQKTKWQGMKTVGQLKREQNVSAEANVDSMYQEVVRAPKVFKPLVIPKSLQSSLPYKDKPKRGPKDPRAPLEAGRVAVVHSPHEQKIDNMMRMIRTNYAAKKDKERGDTEQRKLKLKAEKNAIEMRKLKKQKELKKKVCRTISRMDIMKKTAEGQGGVSGKYKRKGGKGGK